LALRTEHFIFDALKHPSLRWRAGWDLRDREEEGRGEREKRVSDKAVCVGT
jgi:hypothetical protein